MHGLRKKYRQEMSSERWPGRCGTEDQTGGYEVYSNSEFDSGKKGEMK